MKKLFYVLATLLLLLPILTSCNHPAKKVSSDLKAQITQPPNNDANKYKFAIYLVKGLSSFESAKTDINKLPLENEPIITESNISTFYWKSQIIKTDKPEFGTPIAMSGTPFVVSANGERIYLGVLFTPISSMSPPEETPSIFMQDGAHIEDTLNRDGYNVKRLANENYYEISAPYKGNDNRSDMRIYNALKDAGILE